MSKAFVILKPDCVGRGLVGEVISRFERKGFEIINIKMTEKSVHWVRYFYSHLPESILKGNVHLISGRLVIGVVLAHPSYYNAAGLVKSMVGATDSTLAPPGTIRGDYGSYPIRFNIIHCSDPGKVDSEIEAFFGADNDC